MPPASAASGDRSSSDAAADSRGAERRQALAGLIGAEAGVRIAGHQEVPSAGQWAHAGTALALWMLLPLLVGTWRIMRRDVAG